MGPVYILIAFLLIFMFFGPIIDLVMAKDNSRNLQRIKIKVFVTSFAVPIIFGVFIWYVLLTDYKVFNIWTAVALVIITLIRAFFGNRKYIISFKLGSTQLELSYLTSLLKEEKYIIALNEITDFETTKPNLLIDNPAQINIKSKDGWNEFHLIDKRFKSSIQGDIDVAIQRFGISRV